jgi:alkylation response protein AidB-like acyl-CoA dehydrogenase
VTAPRNEASVPGTPSVYEELCVGRCRWDLYAPFPEQDAAGRAAGDRAIAGLRALLEERLDPTAVDAAGCLPDGLVDELRSRGYLRLSLPPDLGGLGLSHFNAFRAIEAAARWSVPVALTMAIPTAIGAGAYLPAVEEGPLRELLRARLAAGDLSGTADTEPTGAANQRRWTVATPIEGGAAYALTGEKMHVGCASVADLLAVTATVGDVTRLLFVDAHAPGVTVSARHEFMGLRGFPNAALRFEDVRVPAGHLLVEDAEDRLTPALGAALDRGRMFLIAAPALAISRLCLRWSREFATRRSIDGRGLGEYDQIQRIVAGSVADVLAMESVVLWAMLGEERPGLNPRFEQVAAKNILSIACWRVVERTMSLLAAEGYETASSKARRGAAPEALERAFRDARGLRISGGVDFQLDNWVGRLVLMSYYWPAPDNAAEIESGDLGLSGSERLGLTPANQDHLAFAAAQTRALARFCLDLSRAHPDPAGLAMVERPFVLLSRIANELLTMQLTLARTAHLAAAGPAAVQAVADVFCAAARHRVLGWRAELETEGGPDHAAVSERWLRGGELDALLGDLPGFGAA